MTISQIKPTEALKALLEYANIVETVYAFGERGSNLPKNPFIEISFNGDINRKSIQQQFFETTLMLTINVPLMAKDVINKTKQELIFKDVEKIIGTHCQLDIVNRDKLYVLYNGMDILFNGDYIVYNQGDYPIRYEFSPVPSSFIINSKSIVSGYSTLGLNLKCLIYNI